MCVHVCYLLLPRSAPPHPAVTCCLRLAALQTDREDMGGASFDRDGEDVNVVERAENAETVKQLHALVLDYIRLPTTTQY